MKLFEIFGLAKKQEPERGTVEQRNLIARKILNKYLEVYNTSDPASGQIRALLKKDMLDPLELQHNNIMRQSLRRTIVGSDKSLDELEALAA